MREGEFIKLGTGVEPCGVGVDDNNIYWGVYVHNDAGGLSAGTTIGRANKANGQG